MAKPGYDVDTASLANMAFSSSLVAARIAYTSTLTVADYTGSMSASYKRAIYTFPSAFPKPPIVMVAGLNGDGTTDQSPLTINFVSDQSGTGATIPFYEIQSFTDRFELYVAKESNTFMRPSPATWRYWVFANTLGT